MKIDYKNEYVLFGEVATGECFEYNGYFYMKTDIARKGDYKVNAVNLSNGALTVMDLDAKVQSVNLKVVNGNYRSK